MTPTQTALRDQSPIDRRFSQSSFITAAYSPAEAGQERSCSRCGQVFVLDPVDWRDTSNNDAPVCESCAQAWHNSRPAPTALQMLPMVQRLVRQRIGSCLLFVNLDRSDSLYVYVLTTRPSQTNTRKRKGSPVYADARIVKLCLVSNEIKGDFERKALPVADLVVWSRDFFKHELGVDLVVPCAMVGGGTLGMILII